MGPDQFATLRHHWEGMQDGPDMTVFQSFEWHSIVNDHFLLEGASRRLVRCSYYLVMNDDGTPAMIAPIRVHLVALSHRHRRGVHFMGRNGHSDYLNFVYRQFDGAAARLVMDRVRQDYGTTQFLFERLLVETDSFRWLARLTGVQIEQSEAVRLVLPATVDEYTSQLSRSTRQNLRTARNRARRDGLSLTVVCGEEIEPGAADQFRDMKNRREFARRDRSSTALRSRLLGRARDVYFGLILSDFDEAYTSMRSLSRVWYLSVGTPDQLCAFAYGLPDTQHGRRVLRILQVGIEEEFGRYSPGMIGLHEFITSQVAGGRFGFDVVDFTRGGEKYKYDLGGTAHYLADLSLRSPR